MSEARAELLEGEVEQDEVLKELRDIFGSSSEPPAEESWRYLKTALKENHHYRRSVTTRIEAIGGKRSGVSLAV
ncbi:MAG: hypothetical protein AAF492_14300, partial [Verrucomicrobiota bacterium]